MGFEGIINRKECNNCRFGWETGGCQKMIYQSPIFCWRPMTEAQLIEKLIQRKENKPL